MNTRCYRCGWSFSLSREALEEAAVGSGGQKAHVIHCPRCRQAISIPMDQIMRALPPGWTAETAANQSAPAGTEAAGVASGESAETNSPANGETAAAQVTAPESASTSSRSQRRHRHSGKTNIGDSATVPAAKNSTHPN